VAGLGAWVWFRSDSRVAMVPAFGPDSVGFALAGSF